MDIGLQSRINEGFQSQIQYKCQQSKIQNQNPFHQKKSTISKIQISFIVPPAQQIKNKKYSLRPDIEMGWKPRILPANPIPITFQAPKYQAILKRLMKNQQLKNKICYLGPKYENTYYAWHNKPFKFPYSHLKQPFRIKYSNRIFCGRNFLCKNDCLQFDSMFQSGNLDSAIRIGQRQYDLFMRVDSNTKGHLQWFNFKIKNIQPNQVYKFNICNFKKKKILFFRGAKPYVFSTQKMDKQNIGWQQQGQNITFTRSNSQTFKLLEIQSKNHYKLTFQFSTHHQNDEMQFAYCIPYTYSHLNQYLQKKTLKFSNQKKNIMKIGKLCNSLGGLQVPLLIIHQNSSNSLDSFSSDKQNNFNLKKCIIICGRAHPGQSNGSFMIQGFLDFILGDSKMAQFLRTNIIFKIVPMVNVDGVSIGNFRTGLSGKDFNRQYKDPDPDIFPEIYSFKKLVQENKKLFKQNLSLFLDFHGHSVKKNTFTYGPQFSISNKFYYESRIFPKVLSNLTPMFRYHSCSFTISECKKTTARAVVIRRIHVPLAFTIQTSNNFYYDSQQMKDVPYTIQKWKLMGEKICIAVHHYIQLVVKAQQNRAKKQQLNKKIKKQIGTNRRNFKSFSSHKYTNKKQIIQTLKTTQSNLIFQQVENDPKLKNLFQQIKKAQKQKQNINQNHQLKCSDDQLSQGSSDGQGQEDDLNFQKMTELFNLIKHKTIRQLDKYKEKSSIIQGSDQEQLIISNINPSIVRQSLNLKKINKQKNNTARPNLIKSKHIISNKRNKSQDKKDYILNNIIIDHKIHQKTTKLINFNFGINIQQNSNSIQRNKRQQKSIPHHTIKISYFDLARQSKQIDEQILTNLNPSNNTLKQNKSKNKFNDYLFRQNYTNKIRQLSKQIEKNHISRDKDLIKDGMGAQIQSFIPQTRKSNRLENYKLRKITNSALNQTQNNNFQLQHF